jgi:hypothetical protein
MEKMIIIKERWPHFVDKGDDYILFEETVSTIKDVYKSELVTRWEKRLGQLMSVDITAVGDPSFTLHHSIKNDMVQFELTVTDSERHKYHIANLFF